MTNSYNESNQALLNNLGQKIRELRTKSDLSQEKLAFTCDLDRTYIGSVERGERNVSIINLQKIANALNVELHELLNF